MDKITYEPIVHKGLARIAVRFAYNAARNKHVAALPGAAWSRSLGCWHIPDTPENRNRCGLPAVEDGKPVAPPATNAPERTAQPLKQQALQLSPANTLQLQLFVQRLQLKGYSASTIKTYRNEFAVFLTTLGRHDATAFTPQRIRDYLQYCHTRLGLSENTLHSRINALKFYYEQVLGRERFFWEIPRSKKPLQLPKVISEDKILQGLNALSNLKHKTLLMVAYSGGLRVSEAVRLRLTDIDRDRMQLFIARSKGKKDRVVPLARILLPVLDQYLKQYQPKEWLFENQGKSGHYSTRSAQIIFRQAYAGLGLPDNVSFHSMRHSYATHLLENGIDIAYIQSLLGHNDIKTTMRYTHVSKKVLGSIENPLDAIVRKRGDGNG